MGEGKSMQREEEDKTTMPDLEKETMEKGGRGVDLRSGKRNDVEGETVSRDGGTNKEEMKWLSSKSQSLEKKSLANAHNPPQNPPTVRLSVLLSLKTTEVVEVSQFNYL